MNTITMIDYGIGNLRSVQKALEHVGAEVALTESPEAILQADKLVLPGVGAFGPGMDALRQRDLIDPLCRAATAGSPVLGICLGMQLLFDSSDEMGEHRGLGLLPGSVVRFAGDGLKVPHMGWNQIEHDGQHVLLQNVPSGAHAYFVHSYYCRPGDSNATLAETEYGHRFPAIAGRENVVGIQFHPEKSQNVGLQILKNFVNL